MIMSSLLFYVGRLSSVTILKLNDNCLSSLPFSIGGYCLLIVLLNKFLCKGSRRCNVVMYCRINLYLTLLSLFITIYCFCQYDI